MELVAGETAVVTGASSGIGFALADRFARSGLNVVLADIEVEALARAQDRIAKHGVDAVGVVTDVSDEQALQRLAAKALDQFGSVAVLCNNAGVGSFGDEWFGPISTWQWVLGVNLWGVINGVRAFLPTLVAQGRGYIVNTASMAGLMPGTTPSYDASKHAVVAISEDLYRTLQTMGSGVGVSVLCPGWVRTNIMDAERNWPAKYGELPERDVVTGVVAKHTQRAVDEGTPPAVVADLVAEAIGRDQFWVLPHEDFLQLAVSRWYSIAERENPTLATEVPGFPPMNQIVEEIAAALAPEQSHP